MKTGMKKTRKARILGVTFAQFMILTCLALAAVGAIFGTFILISSSGTPGGLSLFPSQPASSAQSTSLPGLPGSSGLSPTLPPILNDQVPANWVPYSSTTIEVRVPPQFEAVHASIERQRRIEAYRAAGFAFLADRLANDTFDYRLWFNYPQPETVIYDTHIVVKADILPTTVDEYVDQTYGAGLPGFQQIDRQEITIGNLQARRVLLTANLNDLPIGIAEYVITDEVNLWVISCSSSLEEFYFWLPEFDRVARSFRLLY
jgi:hypothetical protein